MKKPYIKPANKVSAYCSERGYAWSVALYKDYVLIEGNDASTLRAADPVTEFTDDEGRYETGDWIIPSI